MSLTGFISYKRVGWTGQTPWNPTNLNIMDKGIKDNNDMIANLRSEVSALNSNIGNMQTIVIPRGKKGWYKLFSYQVYDWNYMSMFMIISHNFAIDLVMSTVRTIMKDNVSLIDKTATFIKSLTNYGSTMNNISIVNDFGAIVEDNKITYYLLVNNIRTESYMTVYTSSESKSFKINPDVEYIGESLKLDVVPVLHLISN